MIHNAVLNDMEQLIRRDPARRGLIAFEETRGVLCPGHLAHAARDLAANARRVVIVTGFYIPGATPPAPETDGPPGAALLGAALDRLGIPVQIATDQNCRRVVEVAARQMDLPESCVATPGSTPDEVERWFHETADDKTLPPWTHLIAIERVGPSHTRQSIRDQFADPSESDACELADFERLVPAAEQGPCYNMRGVSLDGHTAPLHCLFDLARARKSPTTIGIGDGGNEIGMGSIRWQELRLRLNNPETARIPCRIPTDWTIVAGVSNWGAMALAAATLRLRDCQSHLADWSAAQQQTCLEQLVLHGPAVDGITRLREPTVDGLPFLTYIQPWEGLCRVALTSRG